MVTPQTMTDPAPARSNSAIAIGIAQSQGGNGEQDQTGEEHEHHGQDCLDLPIDPNVAHVEILCGLGSADSTEDYARCFPEMAGRQK